MNYKQVQFCLLIYRVLCQGRRRKSRKVAEDKAIKTKIKLLYQSAQKWDSVKK